MDKDKAGIVLFEDFVDYMFTKSCPGAGKRVLIQGATNNRKR